MATTCGQFLPGNMKLWEGFPGLPEFSWLDDYSYHGLLDIISPCTGVTVTQHHSLAFNKTTRNINDGLFGGPAGIAGMASIIAVGCGCFCFLNLMSREVFAPLPLPHRCDVLVVQPLHGDDLNISNLNFMLQIPPSTHTKY